MSKERYQKRIDKIRKSEKLCKFIYILYTVLPFLMFIAYPTMIIVKLFSGIDLKLLLMILIPAATLLIVTFMRKIIDRQRPYEKFDTPSLFKRSGEGESFPSRHTASAFILAMCGFALSPYLASTLLLIAAVIAFTRVIAGVHYFTDVLAGALLSILAGMVFIFI